MTPLLALQAAAVYASALVLARFGAASERRVLLVVAVVLVLALPTAPLVPWAAWDLGPVDLVGAAVPAFQEPAAAGPPAVVLPAAATVPRVVAGVWAAGVVVAGLRLVADLVAVARLRSSARERAGDVAVSGRVAVPLVVGLVRPLVLLPTAAAGWTGERRAHVLAHERAHAAGFDNLWVFVARVAACVHWFDPLAWRLVAALRDANERRADDVALAGGVAPADYARTLVDVARHAPVAASALSRPSGLEGRVRAILGDRPARRPAWAALRLGGIAALAVGTATAAPSTAETGVVAVTTSRVDTILAAEADRLTTTYQPDGLALVVIDPRTRTLLGQLDRGGLLERPVAPGSVLKPFTVQAALEAGVPATTVFDGEDMGTILSCSSNTGAVAIGERVGRSAVEAMYGRVGLPAPASLPLDDLVLGQARVTPRRVAAAWLHLAGADPASAQVRTLLRGVTETEKGTARAAAVPGMHVAGKTGTSFLVKADGSVDETRFLTSFVGLAPAEAPELLVLVMVAGPHTDEPWGGKVAAPAFARLVEALGG